MSKRVENAVEKGEIARYEQFLLFPQCFQKACFPGVSKGVIVWEWVKRGSYDEIYLCLIENIVGKGDLENIKNKRGMLFTNRQNLFS